MADIDRHELHTLVDHIPESDVPAARKILRALADPVELAILARRWTMSRRLRKSEPRWRHPWPTHLPTSHLNSSGANWHEESPISPAGGQGSGAVAKPQPGPSGEGHRAVCPNRLWRHQDAGRRGTPTQVARGRLASSFRVLEAGHHPDSAHSQPPRSIPLRQEPGALLLVPVKVG